MLYVDLICFSTLGPVLETNGGNVCNTNWHKQRDCESIANCSECIAILHVDLICFSTLGPVLETNGGNVCNTNWHKQRDCESITNCSECIAVYPQFKGAERVRSDALFDKFIVKIKKKHLRYLQNFLQILNIIR